MRSVILLALLATGLSMNSAKAQNPPKPPAKHSGTSATDALTENAPERPGALAEARQAASPRNEPTETTPGSIPPSTPARAPLVQPLGPMVQAVPPGPPQKNLTGGEFAFIHVGSTEKAVLELLGPPSSRVVVPDDDGHLRESLQYWVKGNPMGIVRLDNGRVVQIESQRK